MALAVAQVKDGNHGAGGGTALTVTFDAGIAAGSIILAVWHYAALGNPFVSLANSAGDTATDSGLGDLYDGNSILLGCRAFLNPTTGANSVTLTVTGSAAIRMVIYEVSGFDAGTASWDQTHSQLLNGTECNSHTTATLAQADEVAVGYGTGYSNAFLAVGGGFTADGGDDTTFQHAIAGHQVLSSTTGIAFSATTVSGTYIGASAIVATVKGTVSAAAAVPFNQTDWAKPQRLSNRQPDASRSLNPNLQKNPVPNNQTDWAKPFRVPHITPDASRSLNPNLQKNPLPNNQTDWAKPQRVPGLPPDRSVSLNPNLFKNPMPFPAERLPTRAVPHVPGRTYNAVLYDVVASAPFNQADWAKPRRVVGAAPPVPQSLNPNLFTNPVPFNQVYWPSTFFPRVLGQPPAPLNLNLPNPLPFRAEQLPSRWVPHLPGRTYNAVLYEVTVVAGPFNQTDFARPFFPRGLKPSADSLNINLFTNAMPFSQFDWSKPQQIRITQPQPQSGLNINLFTNPLPVLNLGPGAPFAVRALPTPSQAYNPNLYGVVAVSLPLNQYDFAKPFFPHALPLPSDPLNINLFTNAIPLNQTDWAVSRRIVYETQVPDGLNLNLFTNPLPFGATDTSSHRLASLTPPDQPYNAALYTVTVVAAQPFTQGDAPLLRRPLPAAVLSDPLNPNLFRNDVPVANADWSTSLRLRAATDTGQPLNLNLFGIFVPLSQFDFAAAAKPKRTTAPASDFNPNLQTNPLPFSQFDYQPAHRVPLAPLDLSRGQPNPNIFTNPLPFLQADVGIVRSVRGARPFDAINVALLGTPVVAPVLPFNQFNFTPATKPQPQRRHDLLNPTLIASFVPPPPDAEQHSKPFFVTPGRLMNI